MSLAIYHSDTQQADRLGIMVFLAAALHGIIILGVGFAPLLQETKTPPSLEVILVDKRSELTPEEADYLAQVAQDGGGDSEEYNRPSSPFVSSQDFDTDGFAPAPMIAGSPDQAQITSNPILTALFSEKDETIKPDSEASDSSLKNRSQFRIDQNMEIARLSSELDRQLQEYAKRPRKNFFERKNQRSRGGRIHASLD